MWRLQRLFRLLQKHGWYDYFRPIGRLPADHGSFLHFWGAADGPSGTGRGGRDHSAPYEDVRCTGLLLLFKWRRPLHHSWYPPWLLPFISIRTLLWRPFFPVLFTDPRVQKDWPHQGPVRKWIDTPDFDRYEKFVCDWHYYLKDLEEEIVAKADDPSFAKMVSLSVLKVFYMMPYDGAADFYGQFYSRMRQFGWNGWFLKNNTRGLDLWKRLQF